MFGGAFAMAGPFGWAKLVGLVASGRLQGHGLSKRSGSWPARLRASLGVWQQDWTAGCGKVDIYEDQHASASTCDAT